jgi:14-3-3 protein epsilon
MCELLVFQLKVAEQAERYDDMVLLVKQIITHHTALTEEERNLLSSAYKNSVSKRRISFRTLTAIEEKEEIKSSSRAKYIKELKAKIEEEVGKYSEELSYMIDNQLISAAESIEAKAFYIKMKADFTRYYCECLTGPRLKEQAEMAKEEYETCRLLCRDKFNATSPYRLGLYLNYSVFCFEIMKDNALACKIAKECYEEANSAVESAEGEEYNIAKNVMQMIKDNLDSWQVSKTAEEFFHIE